MYIKYYFQITNKIDEIVYCAKHTFPHGHCFCTAAELLN